MKRQLRHGMLLAVAASLFALTGCDSGDTYYDFGYPRTTNNGSSGANNDDSRLYELANTLRGHWNGAMRYEYTDDNGKRSIAQFDAQMEFDQYDATRLEGRGQEVDAATVNGKRRHRRSLSRGLSTKKQAISTWFTTIRRRNTALLSCKTTSFSLILTVNASPER